MGRLCSMNNVNKKSFSFAKAGIILLGLTLAAKFLAFGRELAVAAYFGSSPDTDSFFIANGLIGNILYGLTTALAAAFLPVYIGEKEKNGRVAANKFVGQSILFFLLIALIFAVAVFAASGFLTGLIAPSVSGKQAGQITLFIRILSAGLIFSLLNSFACSLLDAERIFGYTAFSGIIYSGTVIITAVFFSGTYGISALVIAVSGAHILQFLFSFLRSRKFVTAALPSKGDPRLWNMLLISLPILLSNATVEINQVINRALAIKLGTGVVSAFSYASTLAVFVTGTLIYSLVTIFFTEFSRAACQDDIQGKMKDLLRSALHILLIILLPLTLITVFFAEDIVYIALKRGKFTANDVILTAQGLRWYATGFLGIVCKALFTKCFIAMKNTKTPMLVSIFEVGLNIALAFLLYRKFQVSGITAAIAFANICAAITLFVLLWYKLEGHLLIWSWKYAAKIFLTGTAAILVLVGIRHILMNWNAFGRFPVAVIVIFTVFLPLYWVTWCRFCAVRNR